jgi:hypothetical protein
LVLNGRKQYLEGRRQPTVRLSPAFSTGSRRRARSGAASLRSGSQTAASSFSLSVHGHSGNGSPQDIVTDGASFWVVDGTAHTVFKYTLSGSPLGSWAIDPANTQPTGITINPSNVSDIWIVDERAGRVGGVELVTCAHEKYFISAARISQGDRAGAVAIRPPAVIRVEFR